MAGHWALGSRNVGNQNESMIRKACRDEATIVANTNNTTGQPFLRAMQSCTVEWYHTHSQRKQPDSPRSSGKVEQLSSEGSEHKSRSRWFDQGGSANMSQRCTTTQSTCTQATTHNDAIKRSQTTSRRASHARTVKNIMATFFPTHIIMLPDTMPFTVPPDKIFTRVQPVDLLQFCPLCKFRSHLLRSGMRRCGAAQCLLPFGLVSANSSAPPPSVRHCWLAKTPGQGKAMCSRSQDCAQRAGLVPRKRISARERETRKKKSNRGTRGDTERERERRRERDRHRYGEMEE